MFNKDTALVLRVCMEDGTSRGGFKWPDEVGAVVEAPDWDSKPECGGGLHGWLHGAGSATYTEYWSDPKARWCVLEVKTSEVVDLGGKCKFPRAIVRFIGCKTDASQYVIDNDPEAVQSAVIGGVVSVKDAGVGIVADLGLIIGGDYSPVTGGYRSTVTGGDGSTVTGGDGSTVTGGYRSTVTGGYRSTVTGGDYSTVTGGDGSTVTGGDYSTVTGGDGSELRIKWWDARNSRCRTAIAYVGEKGIKARTPYVLDAKHNFTEKEQ